MGEVVEVRPGQVWKERRAQYAARRVYVQAVDAQWSNGFVTIRTLRKSDGLVPGRPVVTRVRLNLWHRTFEPVMVDE